MSGVFGWLDTLTQQVGNVAGKAVDVVGQVTAAQTAAAQAAQQQQNARPVNPVATLSASVGGSGNTLLWVGAAVVGIVAAVVLLRK